MADHPGTDHKNSHKGRKQSSTMVAIPMAAKKTNAKRRGKRK